jgi:hypothetical protein
METLISLSLSITTFISFAYLVYCIYRQKRAEKKLEFLIKAHKDELQRMIRDYKGKAPHSANSSVKSEFGELVTITFVKNQINLMSKSDKAMMHKVIERKNYENQQRYISKLFYDSGLSNLLIFKGTNNRSLVSH